jgi:spore maturation protein CgeB
MKILIIGSFSEGAMENFYSSGLGELGMDVVCFDIQKPVRQAVNKSMVNKVMYRIVPGWFVQDLNNKIISLAKKEMADYILVFKGMEVLPRTLEQLKSFTGVLANYNPDHPFEFYSRGAGNKNVSKGIPHYDIHFSYSKNIVSKLRSQYEVKAEWIPFGYDEPSVKNITYYDYLADKIVFVGAWDRERERIFSSLPADHIRIYGPAATWTIAAKRSSAIKSMYSGEAYGQEYYNITASAKASVNIMRKQNLVEDAHNMRTIEVLACNTFLIVNDTTENRFFATGKSGFFFKEEYQIPDCINQLPDGAKKTEIDKSRILSYAQLAGRLAEILTTVHK